MSNNVLLPTLFGLGTGGVGIGLGGLVAYYIAKKFSDIGKYILASTAGMIFYLLGFELLPESIEIGGLLPTVAGGVVGLLTIQFIEKKFHKIAIITGNPKHSMLIRTSLLLALGVAIHNLPVGFSMGVGFINQPKAGIDLATTMLFHNFPEGIAISLPLVLSNLNKIFIPIGSTIVALPAGLGSMIGSSIGSVSPMLVAFFFGISIGTILFVTWHEILCPARKQMVASVLLGCLVFGVVLGKIFTYLLE